jgi:hypothetical protein
MISRTQRADCRYSGKNKVPHPKQCAIDMIECRTAPLAYMISSWSHSYGVPTCAHALFKPCLSIRLSPCLHKVIDHSRICIISDSKWVDLITPYCALMSSYTLHWCTSLNCALTPSVESDHSWSQYCFHAVCMYRAQVLALVLQIPSLWTRC